MKKDLQNHWDKMMDNLNNQNNEDKLPGDVSGNLDGCKEGDLERAENLRMKKVLKRAIERTPVSKDLALRIMEKIRDSNLVF